MLSVTNTWLIAYLPGVFTACRGCLFSSLSIVRIVFIRSIVNVWWSESIRSGIKPARSSPSAVVVHAAAAHRAVPSVNSRPSLVSCHSLHFLEHSARRRAVCTVCLFLPATAKDIPVSPVISRHYSLNSVLRYRGLCNSLGCFSHAKNSWLTLTLTLMVCVSGGAGTSRSVRSTQGELPQTFSRWNNYPLYLRRRNLHRWSALPACWLCYNEAYSDGWLTPSLSREKNNVIRSKHFNY